MDSASPTVAIIGGTGAEGSAIAVRLGHVGYRVIIGTRNPSKAERVVSEINEMLGNATVSFTDNVVSFTDNVTAAGAAEIVILTVPYSAQRSTVEEIRGALENKILIDATVPLVPPKVSHVQLPHGGSAVAAIQDSLGDNVQVVSAFQNVAAHKLRELGQDVECDVLVCANDANARKTVLDLITKMGLRGIDAGPICNSAAAEALTSVLIFLNRKYKVSGSGIKLTGLE